MGLQNTPTESLQLGEKTPHNKCPGYYTNQSDGEGSVMLKLRGIQSTPSLTLLQGPLWPGVGAPDRTLSMGQKGLNCELLLN